MFKRYSDFTVICGKQDISPIDDLNGTLMFDRFAQYSDPSYGCTEMLLFFRPRARCPLRANFPGKSGYHAKYARF